MSEFLYTVLSLTLAGSALGLIVLLVSKLAGKKLSSRFIYLCWALVILRFALPFNGLIGVSFVNNTAPQAAHTAVSGGDAGLYVSPLNRTEGVLTRESANENVRKLAGTAQQSASVNDTVVNMTAQTGAQAKNTSVSPAVPLYKNPEFWFYMWLGGALISFVGTIASFGRFRRLLYRTLKPAKPLDRSVLNALNASPFPALYRSDKVSTTVLLGLIRPVIVLPDREYTSDDLDRILRHELTHYRRGDLALKWLQTLVYAVHWFNPLVYLFRAQTTLYCELSCDQKLLKRMGRNDKQSYGELLLNLAADRALPRRVIAVSFTTQKRDLKERLVQIMTFKKLGKQALALSLAVVIAIFGCAFVLGPAKASSAADADKEIAYQTINVSTVDEFIAALGSNRKIVLAPGKYDVSTATGYGTAQGEEYFWDYTYGDGYILTLDTVSNLTIEGESGADETWIVTRPRDVAVLSFMGGSNVTLQGVTVGHTIRPEACQGAVISLYGCRNTLIKDSVLFGCGTIGIQANECWKLRCENTIIKECTTGAIEIYSCYDVAFDHCEFHDIKAHDGYPGLYVIESYNNTFLGIYNTDIYSNYVSCLVESSNCNGLALAGCHVYDNQVSTGFRVYGDNLTVEGCEFKNNNLTASNWFGPEYENVFNLDGEPMDAEALQNMQWAEFPLSEQTLRDIERPEGKKLADGTTEYHVSTPDELLACLSSDSVIYLEGDSFELSAAKAYGGEGSAYYYWMQCYDGYELVLIGVNNMKLIGANSKTHVELMPRSADVMAFKYCSDITLENLVLGHIKGAGSCTGDVISFMGCDTCTLNNCELYGCGVNGVNAFGSVDIHIDNSEIYECSSFAAVVSDCEGTQFNNVTIRDCGSNSIQTQRCRVMFSGTTYYSPDYVPESYYDEYYYYDENGEYGEYSYYDDYGTAVELYGTEVPEEPYEKEPYSEEMPDVEGDI
ncbi:MAG: right-handed parallel beta-helix repeat-containing protein [Clostridia bacterium]|nr:right-handed parallel beta-helix repeat-containing protein [Clostridia bacterium]